MRYVGNFSWGTIPNRDSRNCSYQFTHEKIFKGRTIEYYDVYQEEPQDLPEFKPDKLATKRQINECEKKVFSQLNEFLP